MLQLNGGTRRQYVSDSHHIAHGPLLCALLLGARVLRDSAEAYQTLSSQHTHPHLAEPADTRVQKHRSHSGSHNFLFI